jgi:hypothetical protein
MDGGKKLDENSIILIIRNSTKAFQGTCFKSLK